MIVYGDTAFEQTVGTLVAQLRTRAQAQSAQATFALDELRALLVHAGQVEQAARDYLSDEALVAGLEHATDCAARAFVAHWRNLSAITRESAEAVTDLVQVLDNLPAMPDVRVSVKIPEGFAFYALYPEQYAHAALAWAQEHSAQRADEVLVVGIRSIGTALSAAVRAVLLAQNWNAHRLTVRPSGHPFARETNLSAAELGGARLALIVDEGPGLSGSSMVSAARALVAAGLDRHAITFLPGHDNGPGTSATAEIRAWWAQTPAHVISSYEVRWNGRTLPEELAARTQRILPRYATVVRVEDLGAGAWREAAIAEPLQWPPVCAAFERPKFRVVLNNGGAVLWKFAGLQLTADGNTAAEAALTRLSRLAQADWTPAPLGTALGFVAQPWVDGSTLSRGECGPRMLAHLGQYIDAVAGDVLPAHELEASFIRLAKMLYWNARESLDGTLAEHARRFTERVMVQIHGRALRAFGDGRMAPHEWLLTPPGQILKLDAEGHAADHTIIGAQPITWDLAGAIVEWDLDESEAATLVGAAQLPAEENLPELIDFHQMAYAAFRLGQCALCSSLSRENEDEQLRLHAAIEFYRARLQERIERVGEEVARSL